MALHGYIAIKNRQLVGMPVPGTMTSVSWETLQDPTLVFGIPVIGYRLPDGSYLETHNWSRISKWLTHRKQ